MNTITLPGLIDPHVHLRDPGQTDKEDFYSGTAAAIAGGFTTVVDMPNNAIPIMTVAKLKEKQSIAAKQVVSDIGFYFGTLGDNLEEFDLLKQITPKPVLGLKVYLNHTTGGFVLDNKHLLEIFARWPEDLPILFHAEEETFDQVLDVVRKSPRPVHLCHMSTKYELERVIQAKNEGLPVTCGVTPHHLFLSENDEKQLGAFGKMRPPLRTQKDIAFLWKNLNAIDCIESDHAPHTLAEKESDNPPNGIPGLETTLPLLLTAVGEGRLTIDEVVRLCHIGPAKILSLTNDSTTFIEIDLDEEYICDQTTLFSKAKWTPFNGWKMKGRLKKTTIRGKTVFENGKIVTLPGSGRVLSSML